MSVMASHAQEYFSKWGQTGVIDFAHEFGNLITLTAARTLLGKQDDDMGRRCSRALVLYSLNPQAVRSASRCLRRWPSSCTTLTRV